MKWATFSSLLFSLLCSRPAAADLTVFAAASTSDALEKIGQLYEAEGHPKIHFSFAGSSLLGRQIEAGARPDLFVSADRAPVDRLRSSGLLRSAEERDLLSNQLVVIGAPSEPALRSLAELAQRGRIAVGDPETVPAGRYAKKWLEQEGMAVLAHLVPMLDVRATLHAVASGALPLGIVYETDARTSTKVKVLHRVPAEKTSILYPALALTPEGRKLLAFLTGKKARAVFERLGFVVR